MPKGQQRGNKEAKKPKKVPAPAPVPAIPSRATTTSNSGLPRWPKK